MKHQNTGGTPLTLDDGTVVKPGKTFDDKKVDPGRLARWREAGSATPASKATGSAKNDDSSDEEQ